jgi:phenylacetate-CoA ligase
VYVKFDAAGTHPIMQSRYVKRVLDLTSDPSCSNLFYKSPEELAKLKTELFREELGFFYDNNKDFRRRMDNLKINPQDANLEDALQLAIFSDDLRGDGYNRYIIDNPPEGGKTNSSSGTTGKLPVTTYFSPVDYELIRRMNNSMITYLQGNQVDHNTMVLLLAAPEMRKYISSLEYVSDWLENRGVPTIHSMKADEKGVKTPFGTFAQNRGDVIKFLNKDRFFGDTQKVLYGGNDGLYNFLEGLTNSKGGKRIFTKLLMGAPPVELGKNGFVWSGGGPKRMNISYEELREKYKDHVLTKDEEGRIVPAKWIDVLAGTEFQPAIPTIPDTSTRIHHPLTTLHLIDMSKYKLVEGEGQGSLLVQSPFTTYPMIVFPGDKAKRVRLPRVLKEKYQYTDYGYEYVGRMTPEEGVELRTGCPM